MTIIIFGDIITYEDNENYFVTHRVAKKGKESLITKGDRNNELDTEIFKSQVIGKVIFHSLFLGMFITKYLKYVFIVFTIFIIIINSYWNYKKKRDGENGKREEKEDKIIE